MTTQELIQHFNTQFGMEDDEWPETYEVDAETYAHVINFLINKVIDNIIVASFLNGGYLRMSIPVTVGASGGVVLKNVELLVKHGPTTTT